MLILLGTSLGCQHAQTDAANSIATAATEQATQEVAEETPEKEVDPENYLAPPVSSEQISEASASSGYVACAGEPAVDSVAEESDLLSDATDDNDTDDENKSKEEYVPKKPNPNPGKAQAITFEDLKLDLPADTKFRESILTGAVKAVDGERVRLKGFIFAGGIFQQTGIKKFIFVQNLQCKFGPGGEAFCVVLVDLKDGVSTSFTVRPITVEGILSVDPFNSPDGKATYAVYRMVGEKVER
jgi:hypothetical protein